MSVLHHPDVTTLMAFAAGTLEEAYGVVTATHLALCPECRRQVRGFEAMGGVLLAAEDEAELTGGSLESLLGRLDEAPPEPIRLIRRVPGVPAPLARYLPEGLARAPWKNRGGGVATCDLPTTSGGTGRLMLLKVAAGREVPEHGHGGQELTLVLEGAYRDRFGRFGPGDLADHDQEVEHQPIAEPGADCVCLVAVDARLNFRSRLLRFLQPLIGM